MTNPNQQTGTPVADDASAPVVGQAVLVTFFDGSHVIHNVIAHVLATGTLDPAMSTESGKPSLTVAYPADPAQTAKLSSARWYEGYMRQAGVVHYTHPFATDGKVSVVWGYPLSQASVPDLHAPAGDGKNPIFERRNDVVLLEEPKALEAPAADGPASPEAPAVEEPQNETPAPVQESVPEPAAVEGT